MYINNTDIYANLIQNIKILIDYLIKLIFVFTVVVILLQRLY